MDKCFGQAGWREFLNNRKEILAEFDRIKEQTRNRPLKTAHGVGVEAFIRKWLSELLPKKYGVTSGYIIPDIYCNNFKLYHYDIIIYDKLESPVLWTEGNYDDSEQGKYRAIPAKYVKAIYEVKSTLSSQTAKEAINKLSELNELRNHLNNGFSCGIIFIDLHENDVKSIAILKELLKGTNLLNFTGGIVLRYDNDDTSTGLIKLLKIGTETTQDTINTNSMVLAKPIDDLDIYMREDGSVQFDGQGCGIMLRSTDTNIFCISKIYSALYTDDCYGVDLNWSRNNFSEFCTKLLLSLDGTGNVTHGERGFGTVFDHVEMKKCPLQMTEHIDGMPYVKVVLYPGGNNNELYEIGFEGGIPSLKFWIRVENHGNLPIEMSSDSFKNIILLENNKFVVLPLGYDVELPKEFSSLEEFIEKEMPVMTERLVYREKKENYELYAVEFNIEFKNGTVELNQNQDYENMGTQ